MSKTFCKYFHGLTLLSLAVSIIVKIMAALSPPLSDPANTQFFLPMATDRRALSAALLSISIWPLSKNLFKASSLLKAYFIA